MKIYNSLTRRKDEFEPLKKGRVGLYVCGPTVYDSPHIGHARSAYIFDCARRYLEYKGLRLTFVRNVTDVDDKIIEKARTEAGSRRAEDELKIKVREVAGRYLKAYHDDMELLGIKKPDEEPRATEYIPKMIKFIELLVRKGYAYESGGDVYFEVRKFHSYGALSNQSIDKMEAGARVSPEEGKRDPLDFALWKRSKSDEPSWPSPWGEGRPGWHIECSVMSSCLLGDEFDIHGGGIDLIFPHHENEIAQSRGAGKPFARFWMHNGLLTIRGEKMAKSLGNFISIKDFLSRYGDPDYLKLFFLAAHYRSPIDYTEEKIEEARKEKERFRILLEAAGRIVGHHESLGVLEPGAGSRESGKKLKSQNQDKEIIEGFRRRFEKAMDDDFNTPLALSVLFDLVTYANKFIHAKNGFTKDELTAASAMAKELLGLSAVFGLDLSKEVSKADINESEILALIGERNASRERKDFKSADAIRRRLMDRGVILEDTKEGTTWRRRI